MMQKRIPVFSIVWMAIVDVFTNLGKVARRLWPSWLAFVIVLGIAASTRGLTMEPPLRPLLIATLGLLLFLAYGLGFHIWMHRMLVTAAARNPLPIRFLSYLALLTLLLGAPLGLLVVALSDPSDQSPLDQAATHTLRFMVVMVCVALPVFYFAGRLALVLPANVTGDRFGLFDAWRMSMGNGLRLLAIFLLVSYGGLLGLAAVMKVVTLLIDLLSLEPSRPDLVASVRALAVVLALQIVGLVHMSACGHAYRQLTQA